MARGRPTVLAVDDDPAMLGLLGVVLDGHFEVRTATSGAAALALLRQQSVDVILLDLLMPGMDGLELLQRVRALDPRIEVIVVTAVRNAHLVVTVMKHGAFAYLTKPFDHEELRSKIAGAIARRERRAAGTPAPAERAPEPVEQAGPVVLIGPQPGMLAALESLLERYFLVRTAVTAAGAIRLLGYCTPALAVVHPALPTPGRRTVVQALRARAPRCRVIGGDDHADEAERAVREGGGAKATWLPWVLRQITAVLDAGQLPSGFPPRMSAHVLGAIDYVGRNYSKPIGLRTTATAVGISPRHLASLVRKDVGVSLMEYVTRIRIAAARALLAEENTPLEHLAEAVGFSDASHLSRVFVRQVGERPGRYRRHRLP